MWKFYLTKLLADEEAMSQVPHDEAPAFWQELLFSFIANESNIALQAMRALYKCHHQAIKDLMRTIPVFINILQHECKSNNWGSVLQIIIESMSVPNESLAS